MIDLAALLLIGGTAFAQLPSLSLKPPSNAEKAADPAESDVVEVGDLPRRLIEESLFLQQASQRSASAAKADALEQKLDDIKRSIGALGVKIVGRDFSALPYSGLEALRRHLLFLDKRLTQLQEDLRKAVAALRAEGMIQRIQDAYQPER